MFKSLNPFWDRLGSICATSNPHSSYPSGGCLRASPQSKFLEAKLGSAQILGNHSAIAYLKTKWAKSYRTFSTKPSRIYIYMIIYLIYNIHIYIYWKKWNGEMLLALNPSNHHVTPRVGRAKRVPPPSARHNTCDRSRVQHARATEPYLWRCQPFGATFCWGCNSDK